MNSFSSYSQEKSDFRAHFDFTAINIKVRISVVLLQCPCLHIREGFKYCWADSFCYCRVDFFGGKYLLNFGSPVPNPSWISALMLYVYFCFGIPCNEGHTNPDQISSSGDEGKCHDRKVAEMKLSFRPNWQEGRPQLAGGQRKLVWHCIALHCIAISYLRKSQVKLTRVAKFGLKNDFLRMAALTQSKRFFDYYLRAWRFIGTCQREKILTIWCWRLFLSETCIGFTMHNVTAPALHVKCLSCTLSRSALGASLCIDVFLLQKSISAKQYLTASLWVSTKNYVRIMSGKFVLYHPIWIAFEIAFLKGSSNFKCFLTVHTTEFVT